MLGRRQGKGLRVLASLALPMLGCVGEAGAEEERLEARLEWTRGRGGDGCLDAEELALAVHRRWGRPVFVSEGEPDVVLVGTIGRGARGGWAASLEMRRASGESLGSRRISTAASDCSSLDDSIALAAGLMLDVSQQRIAEERQENERRAPTLFAGPVIAVPRETAAARNPWHFTAGLGGEAAAGLFPFVSLGLRGSLAIEPPAFWRLEGGATLWLDSEAKAGTGGARFSAWTVDLAVCPLWWRPEPAAFAGCVVQRLGAVRAEGFGFDQDTTATENLSSFGARAGATWIPGGAWVLGASLELEVPLIRYRFVYEAGASRPGTVYRMAPLVPSLQATLGLRW